MMGKKQAAKRAPQHKAATVPNLYWRSLTMDQLRQEQRVIGLAPVPTTEQHQQQQEDGAGLLSHRYVRQDSQLWSALHDGMLTTGRLKAALGMHESAAASVIGIHPGSRGSSHLLSAYSHLVLTTYSRRGLSTNTNTSNTSNSTSSSSSTSTSTGSAASANGSSSSSSSSSSSTTGLTGGGKPRSSGHPSAHASKPVASKQQQKVQKQFGGLLPRPVMLQVTPPPSAAPGAGQPMHTQAGQQQHQQQQQQQQRKEQEAAAVAALESARQLYNQSLTAQAAGGLVDDVGTGSSSSSAVMAEAARQHSERVAAGGDLHVKLSWGKTQEAAALHCVMRLFPESLLEEVGLFELDVSQLPASWDLQPQLLPPLGASPDAVLVHRLTLLPEDLQAAAAVLDKHRDSAVINSSSNSNSRVDGNSRSAMSSSNSSSSSSDRSSTWEEGVAEAAAVQLLLQRGFDRLACAGSKPVSSVQYADSSSSSEEVGEQGSSSSTSSSEPVDGEADSETEAVSSSTGNTSASSSAADTDTTSSAAVGTSVRQVAAAGGGSNSSSSSSSVLSIEQAGSLAFEPVGAAVLRALRQWQQQQHEGGQQQQQPLVTLVVREAVEVKNHCPFGIRYTRRGKKGRVDLAYKLSPRGCVGHVHPQWIPQLQLHMLATGCQSVLLASRCAAQGMRVYRVWRDDGYLRDMLHLLQELQAAHVLRQTPPRPDSLSRLAAHKPFLHRTVALARAAECVAAVGQDFVASVPRNAVNQEQFW